MSDVREAIDRFAAIVERRLGLVPGSSAREELATLLEEKAPRRQWEQYLGHLEAAAPGDSELRCLAERLTVGETYFFRHQAQLEAVAYELLPALQQASGYARVLCAGCSSGEEAYSLAMLARAHPRVDASRLFITGVDVNPRAIERARQARYLSWSLRATPEPLRERWFDTLPDGEFALRPEVRDAVLFEERNLLEDAPGLWSPGSFDVVLFRNVLIHFSAPAARRAVARLEQALAPGGFLVLGPSETARGLSDGFEAIQAGEAFYFQRRQALFASEPPRAVKPRDTRTPALAELPRAEGPAHAWRLLEQERYAEAQAWLDGLPEDERAHPLCQLLRAALLLQAGSFIEAEQLGEALAGSEGQGAAAHYLLGLCREHAGDGSTARARYQRAVHLEPTFALGHLRLGMLARREGASFAARVALRLALSLLAHEPPMHLLLFGGGFGRHGLMQMCQRELWACSEAA